MDALIDGALSSKAAHFFYLRELSKQHRKEFSSYTPHVKTSLPSHLTEMILQSRVARRSTPSYNFRLALVHARMTYEVWQTANDLNERDESVMTKLQAEKAWPKLIEFQSASGMANLLPTFHELALPVSERPFQQFVKGELLSHLHAFRSKAHPTCNQLEALAAHPRAICDYDMQAVADRIGSRGLNPFIDVALELFALLGVHSAGHNVNKIGKLTDAKVESMQDVAKHAFDLPKAPALIPSVMEEIKAEVMETDAQCGESMDRVEREIGPSEIRTE